MFPIPNTTIVSESYTAAATWEYDAQNVSGYLYCSGAPVYVRLTLGDAPHSPGGRILPEFFMAPGAQTILVQEDNEPVQKVEVRMANAKGGTVTAQFWGILATAADPIRTFEPTNYFVSAGGGFVPPIIASPLIFQHNNVQVGVEQALDFLDNAWGEWTVVDDGANGRVTTAYKPDPGQSGTGTTVTVSATTEAGATTIVTSVAITVDGATPLLVMGYCPSVAWQPNSVLDVGRVCLFDGATSLGILGTFTSSDTTGTNRRPWYGIAVLDGPFLPGAGAHTYSLRGFKTAAADFLEFTGAGAGLGNLFPISIIVLPTTI